jgi:hypothetical protein
MIIAPLTGCRKAERINMNFYNKKHQRTVVIVIAVIIIIAMVLAIIAPAMTR